ncbi:hypothetical protein GGS24DRAFT_320579 [Hypoxylon argillaceum]|nr:hypothetical protein GGS24DRAFT_320579 [Hypoxylon argillaceum]
MFCGFVFVVLWIRLSRISQMVYATASDLSDLVRTSALHTVNRRISCLYARERLVLIHPLRNSNTIESTLAAYYVPFDRGVKYFFPHLISARP